MLVTGNPDGYTLMNSNKGEFHEAFQCFQELTLLNTVLLGTLEVLILLLAGDALDTLVVVVLVGGALGGVGALWKKDKLVANTQKRVEMA